jgi:hypothetical protein
MGGSEKREDREEEDRESERSKWLIEDDDVWGTDVDAAAPISPTSPEPGPLRRSSARKFGWLLFAFLLISVAAAGTYLVYSSNAAGGGNPQPTGSPPNHPPDPPGGGFAGNIIPVLVGIGIGFAVVGAVIIAVRLATLRLGLTLTVHISRPNEGAEEIRLATARVHRSTAEFDGGQLAALARITQLPLDIRGRRSWRIGTRITDLNIDVAQLRLPKSRLRRTVIRLDISEDLVHLPWESRLAASAPGSPDRQLLCFRLYHDDLPLNWKDHARQWRDLFDSVYLGPSHLSRPTEYGAHGYYVRSTRVLHLVGTPVGTKGGRRIRVPSQTLGAEGRGSRADETLLGPVDLFLTRGIQGLLVLQAEPVDGPPETLGELRDGFIDFVLQLDTGSAILVIPPLPDDVARAVIELIRKDIGGRRRPPRPTTLLRLLARVKAMVADAEEAAGSEQHAAGDVLLFMATHV